MADIETLIVNMIETKPSEFEDTFNDLLSQRIGAKIDAIKVDLAKEMFKEDDDLTEISKQKLYDYIGHASMDKSFRAHDNGFSQGYVRGRYDMGNKHASRDMEADDKNNKRHGRRSAGIQLAAAKLAGKGLDKYSSSRIHAKDSIKDD